MRTKETLVANAQVNLVSWEEAVVWLREQPGQEDLAHAAYYDDPADGACDRYWRSEEWAAVRALIGTGPGRALDVGAGRGIASYALAKDGFDVTAMEPDASLIVGSGAIRSIAQQHKLPIAVVDQVSDPLTFPDASFDIIFARAVLHHIPDLNQAMGEFFRILKPGGKFIAIREHVLSSDEDLQAFLDIHPLHHLYGGEMAYRLPVYLNAIAQSGLRIDKVIAPLESPINYAPLDKGEVAQAIAEKLSYGLPGLSHLAALALRLPLLGALLVKGAQRFDNRPGRHFSFLATRP
jgi:SAM-dependent methyltransferase